MEKRVTKTVSAAAIRRRGRRRVLDAYRKRATQACERCKARKTKCVLSYPGMCQKCHADNLTCSLERSICGTNGSLQPARPSSRNRASTDSQLETQLNTQISQESDQSRSQGESAFSQPTRSANETTWPKLLSQLQDVFCLESTQEPNEYDSIIQPLGPKPPVPQAELSRLRKIIDGLPPRHVADFLLDTCMTYGTDSFFYFDQAQFLSEVGQFYSDPGSPLRSDASFVCLVLAAFALGAQRTPLLGSDNSNLGIIAGDHGDPGQIFFERARALIPDVIERSCLRAVQATFALGLYLLPQTAIGSSYVYIGIALRKAMALDLHQPADESVSDLQEREVRRRLWWSIYSLERTLTIKLSRSRSVEAKSIRQALPAPLPSLDNVQRFNNISHQLANIQIIQILDRVAESENESRRPLSLEDVEQNVGDLKRWKQALPSCCRLDSIQPSDASYRAVVHLFMNYYSAWIIMGRTTLVQVARSKLRHAFGRDKDPPQHIEAEARLVKCCIKGATKMIRLFDLLNWGKKIVRFSFTDFQACCMATTVMLIARVLEKDSTYDSRVNFGMHCLNRMAEGNMAAMSGVKFVEALKNIATEACLKLQQTSPSLLGQDPRAANPTETASHFKDWTEWLSIARRSNDSNNHIGEATMASMTPSVTSPMPIGSWPQHPAVCSDAHHSEVLSRDAHMPLQTDYEDSSAFSHTPLTEDLFALYDQNESMVLELTGLNVLDLATFST